VVLAKKESTARSKKLRDYLSPPSNIGQPTECSYAGEHEVKRLDTKRVDSTVHFTFDVRHVRVTLDGEQARSLHGSRRKIKSRDAARPEARKRHAVSSNVTLKMNNVESSDVAKPR
jgi:hypothetical protein